MARTFLALTALLLGCPTPPASEPRRAPTPAPIPRGDAPGGPGAAGRWTSGAKDAIGTAASLRSRVWFTLHQGALTEVYYPRLDQANLRSLALAVRDARGRVWLEGRDLRSSLELLDERALLYRQTSRHPEGLFTLRKTTLCDPERDVLLIEVELEAEIEARRGLALYLLADPALANTAGGDSAFAEGGALSAEDGKLAAALVPSSPFLRSSVGFVGVSDGESDLLRNGRLTRSFARAARGNVHWGAELAPVERQTLALGFGESRRAAELAARASLGVGVARARADYLRGWRELLAPLRLPRDPRLLRQARIAAMVLYALEDKTRRGAMIASLSIPWGEAVSADRPEVGGYHLVWSRDLYQVATAFLAMGDRAAAGRTLDYLLRVQQRPDGSFPQNSWLDGRPYWGSLQLDEVAYPLLLAWRLGRRDRQSWERHLRPAADLLLARGPATPQERWEEESGYSPRSSRPRRNARRLSEERYHLIAETWKKNQALGPRQVRNQLRRTHGLRVGTSTVRKVMEEHGYVPPKITVERREVRRYEAVRPNQQVHLDFLHFFVHKAKAYLLLIEDDYSRFLVGWALCEGERAQPVIEAVDEAIRRHGKYARPAGQETAA